MNVQVCIACVLEREVALLDYILRPELAKVDSCVVKFYLCFLRIRCH